MLPRCIYCQSKISINGFQCKLKETPNALIDSSDTHHFIYSKNSFINFEKIEKEEVLCAFGKFTIVDEVTVKLSIWSGLIVEAYHTTRFSTNIISVGVLSRHFDIHFTCATENRKSQCRSTKPKTDEIIFQVSIQDGLYSIKISRDKNNSKPIGNHDEIGCAICKSFSAQ